MYLLKKNQIPENVHIVYEDDVNAEEKRVRESEKVEIRVRIKEFRKMYPSITHEPVVAVEKMSFGLDYGECFAMLGVNGSGKSTTFKCLTNEFQPTQGQLTINGLDV
jgi:ABC-type multidrug transport system ATPase subunit